MPMSALRGSSWQCAAFSQRGTRRWQRDRPRRTGRLDHRIDIGGEPVAAVVEDVAEYQLSLAALSAICSTIVRRSATLIRSSWSRSCRQSWLTRMASPSPGVMP